MKLWRRLGLPEPRSEASRGELSLVDNEIYSGITVPAMPLFVRLDGWRFHGLAARKRFRTPYDRRFATAMVSAALELFEQFHPALAYVFSDEINLLFLRRPDFERVEKIDSVFAGIASAEFSLRLGRRAAFDCRAIPVGKGDIERYLVWRQAEAWRNHNNACAYWALRRKGMSGRAASERLKGLKTDELRRLARENGLDPAKRPLWEANGILIVWERYKKTGYDPIRKRKVVVERKRPLVNWSPPLFFSREGKRLLKKLTAPPLS